MYNLEHGVEAVVRCKRTFPHEDGVARPVGVSCGLVGIVQEQHRFPRRRISHLDTVREAGPQVDGMPTCPVPGEVFVRQSIEEVEAGPSKLRTR